MTAGLLGILIGWTGAHRFYLGDTAGGLIRLLVLNLVCAGGIVGLIEGIITEKGLIRPVNEGTIRAALAGAGAPGRHP